MPFSAMSVQLANDAMARNMDPRNIYLSLVVDNAEGGRFRVSAFLSFFLFSIILFTCGASAGLGVMSSFLLLLQDYLSKSPSKWHFKAIIHKITFVQNHKLGRIIVTLTSEVIQGCQAVSKVTLDGV